jgi:uncharacterized RDD family membrane protein YckC
MAERAAAAGAVMKSAAAAVESAPGMHATARSRILAYLIDSVVLFCFGTVFGLAAALVLFLDSDQGRDQITDAEAWAFTLILALTIPAWAAAGVGMQFKRGQTVGQYVTGLRVEMASGESLQPKRLLLYWLALHPLLFHPLFCGIWFLLAYVGISLAGSDVLFVLGFGMGLLSLVAPLVSIGFLLSDPERRAIHDRVADIRVQQLS